MSTVGVAGNAALPGKEAEGFWELKTLEVGVPRGKRDWKAPAGAAWRDSTENCGCLEQVGPKIP